MRRISINFLICFSALFIINLIFNAIFKPDLDIITAFSTALGVSSGYIFIGHFVSEKLEGK